MDLRRWAVLVAAVASLGAAPAYDSSPWLQDLEQVRGVLLSKYANLDWLVFDHEVDLKALLDDTRRRVETAGSDETARAAFDRLARRIGDGHLRFDWPTPPGPAARDDSASRCERLGYDADYAGPLLAAKAPGYRRLQTASSSVFPAGVIEVGGRRVGVIKIGLFSPRGFPDLCLEALKALEVPAQGPCDDACAERVEAWTSARLTPLLEGQLEALKAAGARALVVDVAGNGGGSEWAEAAARMVSGRRLTSEQGGFVRGAHWAQTFASDEAELRKAAAAESGADRKLLLDLAERAAALRIEALTPCDPAPYLEGRRPACAWLGKGYFGSGMLASADPARLQGKPWAPLVFSPAQFPYREGVWRGPLVVLIDGDAGSATAEFAAVLQDNRAAAIMGSPAMGGCGHTNGGTPTTLGNSKAVLEVPDCARFRLDGSNEMRGIQPDVLVGFAPTDGPQLLARRFAERLPEALALADRLSARRGGGRIPAD